MKVPITVAVEENCKKVAENCTNVATLQQQVQEIQDTPPVEDTDDQRLLWDAEACLLGIEDGGEEINISPTTTTGTRAQIKALASSGSLKPGRQYCITGYVRGCITDGKIFLQAEDPSQFSMDVQVLTEHDNLAWEGRYDCDTGRLVELWDNRGNHAQGQTGVEVDRFPWGNLNWRETHVISADVTVDCDTELAVFNTRFETDSAVILTGTTGLIYNTVVENDSQLTLPGADVSIQGTNISGRSRILGNDATAVIINFSDFNSDSYWDFRGQNDVRSISSEFSSTSRVYFEGGDRQWFYNMQISSRADVRQTAGTLQVYYGEIGAFADINMDSDQIWLSYADEFKGRVFIRNNHENRVRSFYNHISSRSEVDLTGTGDLLFYFNSIDAFSRMTVTGTTTIVYTTSMLAQGIVTYSAGTHYRNRWSGLCDITVPFNTRSCYADGRIVYTLTIANTNRGSDYHHLPGTAVPALQ